MESLPTSEQPYIYPPPAEEYQILVPDSKHTEQPTPEALQEAYLERISELIDSAVGDPDNSVDTLVFLDKSARPLAWMMRRFWPYMAPERTNPHTGELEVVPMPAMKFANIDRLPWREDPSVEIAEGGGMRTPSAADIKGLRDIFQIGDANELDDKNILIVDEQSDSGDTLMVAQELFSRAFPSARLRTKAWISHSFTYDHKLGGKSYKHKEVPIWYPVKDDDNLAEDETGRAVFSEVPYNELDKIHPERFKEASYQFMSTRPNVRKVGSQMTQADRDAVIVLQHTLSETDDPVERKKIKSKIHELEYITVDAKGMQLRREIGKMAVDFLNGTLNPAIYSERVQIRGVPADEYLRASSGKREARRQPSRLSRSA